MAKTPTPKDLLDQLARRFDVDDVGQRVQGGKRLDFIGIDKTITRYNEVLGAEWGFTVIDTELQQIEVLKTIKDSEGNVVKDEYGRPKKEKVPQFLATVTGELQALGKRAGGVGADVADDPDKAIKTALAEALKKASHQFGTALYLWNEEERNTVQKVRTAIAAGDEITPLKTQVMQKALDAGVEANAEKIAAHFKVSVADLQNIDILRELAAYG